MPALRSTPGDDHAVPGLANLRLIVTLDGPGDGGTTLSWADFIAAGHVVSEQEARRVADAVTPDDVVDILFTSGTTGVPKGVMSAHRQTLSVARAWARGAELTPDDRYAVVNPYFHGFGYKAGMISSLVSGATNYPVAVFHPDELLRLIQEARITVLPGVPTIFTSLLDYPHLRDYDLSSLRFAIAARQPLQQRCSETWSKSSVSRPSHRLTGSPNASWPPSRVRAKTLPTPPRPPGQRSRASRSVSSARTATTSRRARTGRSSCAAIT